MSWRNLDPATRPLSLTEAKAKQRRLNLRGVLSRNEKISKNKNKNRETHGVEIPTVFPPGPTTALSADARIQHQQPHQPKVHLHFCLQIAPVVELGHVDGVALHRGRVVIVVVVAGLEDGGLGRGEGGAVDVDEGDLHAVRVAPFCEGEADPRCAARDERRCLRGEDPVRGHDAGGGGGRRGEEAGGKGRERVGVCLEEMNPVHESFTREGVVKRSEKFGDPRVRRQRNVQMRWEEGMGIDWLSFNVRNMQP